MTIIETFRNHLELYNNAIFPMQIITMIVAAVLTCYLFIKPSSTINKLIKAYLAFTYTWIAVVFNLILLFPEPGPALLSGVFQIIISILFVVDIFAGKIEFKLPETKWKKYLTLFWVVFAFALYPLIEWFLGHPYPEVPLLGLLFCPTTIFSIALLTGAIPKVDKKVFILLIILAIFVGISAPITLGVYVDLMLLLCGIYGLVMLIKNYKVIGIEKSKTEEM